jgi:hypothetical protein
MYFVVEKDRVIALDITEALREYRAGVVVHVFDTVEQARAAMAELGQPDMSVLSLSSLEEEDPAHFPGYGTLAPHVVLIVDDASNAAALPVNCVAVLRPFGSSALADALIKLGGGPA